MRMKHDWATRDDVSREMIAVAHRRTDFLFAVAASYKEASIRTLLASAYLQGIDDAVDTLGEAKTPRSG